MFHSAIHRSGAFSIFAKAPEGLREEGGPLVAGERECGADWAGAGTVIWANPLVRGFDWDYRPRLFREPLLAFSRLVNSDVAGDRIVHGV